MNLVIHIFIFLISCLFLYISGEWVVKGLMKVARFLGWREFVVAFLVMAFAATIPNIFVGISSILHKIPELSFGEVVGGNVVDLTLAIGLATLIAGGLPADSRLIQTSSIWTMIIAILPILLIFDGELSRGDGLILLFCFFLYIFWIFSKKERFTKIYAYKEIDYSPIKKFREFFNDFVKIILGIILLLLAAEGIVRSAIFFSQAFNMPITLVGILIVGLGNAIPETYFAVSAAKKGETWMILGDLMGAVIMPATLVLGIVALIQPIVIEHIPIIALARFFLIISALFFFLFVRTDRKITKKEAVFLISIYIIFFLIQILFL